MIAMEGQSEFLDKEGTTRFAEKSKEWVQSVAKAHSAGTADSATSAATAAKADVATKLGTENVGDASTPIFLEAGVPKPGTPPASYKPGGTSSQILLGDGTAQDISAFITGNIEAIRAALGLATTEHMGLVPQLPSA